MPRYVDPRKVRLPPATVQIRGHRHQVEPDVHSVNMPPGAVRFGLAPGEGPVRFVFWDADGNEVEADDAPKENR